MVLIELYVNCIYVSKDMYASLVLNEVELIKSIT